LRVHADADGVGPRFWAGPTLTWVTFADCWWLTELAPKAESAEEVRVVVRGHLPVWVSSGSDPVSYAGGPDAGVYVVALQRPQWPEHNPDNSLAV